MTAPLRVVEALDLDLDVDMLSARRQAFDCVHLGMRDLPIGAALNLLRTEPGLRPPRTGHLGNWNDIAHGRAGAMDFNQAICVWGYGYPLIHCFTQTEADGGSGDWVYLPGSIVDRGQRTELALYTWDGTAFVHRSREHALFCPFVQAEVDGALVSLSELHWERMRDTKGFSFALEAQVILDHVDAIRPILSRLIEDACRRENPRRALLDLVSHAAAPDGRMGRCEMHRDGAGFVLDGHRFPSIDALVEAALIPFRAVTNPREFVNSARALPARVPVLSNLATGVLTAVFATHFPGLDAGGLARVTRPFNAHLHWGARDMAGYPPRRRGYFVEKSTLKSLRAICGSLVAGFPEVNPVCMVLVPASVFMLCPTSAHPRDAELVGELLQQVSELDEPSPRAPDRLLGAVEATTWRWLAQREPALSPYFRNRFHPRGGVVHRVEMPSASVPVEPDCFRALTFRRACMVVGALVHAVGGGS